MTRLLALAWRMGHGVRLHAVFAYTSLDKGWGYYCATCDEGVKAAIR